MGNKFEINPVELAAKIEESVKRYILTVMGLNSNYPKLSDAFKKLIMGKKLLKGPYVEALPDFEKGKPIEKLLIKNGGFLHNDFENLPDNILKRKLHKHQEEALKLAANSKNIIVATGTGSGKTETFLFPIIDKILKEGDALSRGVRALIIYPMNALANDQLYFRIAPLLTNQLKNTNITFGRYTSDIKPGVSRTEIISELKQNNKLMEVLNNDIPGNWLLTRDEMLRNPPNILITNYAMLEHILLLPKNRGLFQYSQLNTIVLDEIHTYSGAQASEVAFLLRKLKNYLGINQGIQVFGTSASLASEEDADVNLKKFASDLFGESVHEIIRGKRIPHSKLESNANKRFKLQMNEWLEIGEFLGCYREVNENNTSIINDWNEYFYSNEIPKIEGDNFKQALFKVFYKNDELCKISDILANNQIISFESLCDEIFSDSSDNKADKLKALSAIFYLGMLAKENEFSYPLLPCRYHISVNSINGISVSLGNSDEGWIELRDERVGYDENTDTPYFQLFTCRRCGQPYIEAFYDDTNNNISNRSFSKEGSYLERVVFKLGNKNENLINEDPEGDALIENSNIDKWVIDTNTWRRIRTENTNTVSLIKVEMKNKEDERLAYVTSCINCGSSARGAIPEILTPFHPGNEALSSLITHIVIESVPGEDNTELPLSGKKILTFSDNRQDAAYFAPFFQRTSNDIAIRSAIRNTIYERNDKIPLTEFHYEIKNYLIENDSYILFDENGDLITNNHKKEEVLAGLITAELCTPISRRLSLESLGILRADYEGINKIAEEIESYVPEKNRKHILEIIKFCLDTMRLSKAISKPSFNVDLTDEFYFGVHSYKSTFEIYKTNSTKHIHGFIPQEGTNRMNIRTKFLINSLGWKKDEASIFLSRLWNLFVEKQILISSNWGGFVINSEKIYFHSAKNHSLAYCEVCGGHDYYNIEGKCTVQNCVGKVKHIEDKDKYFNNHHYFQLYSGKHFILRAEEHTASLSNQKRQNIESKFGESKINLLSCTTTMEMGVDLGDLEAIVCLNIPPGISNYQQRTGRAGRRAQAAPFCVTIAKNSLYDQTVFSEFDKYLKQNIQDLYVHLSNDVIYRRHQYSILLRYYLRDKISDEMINSPSLVDVIGENVSLEQQKESVYSWLESENGQKAMVEALSLDSYFTNEVKNFIRINKENLIEEFIKKFMLIIAEISGKIKLYQEWENNAAEERNWDQARTWEKRKKRYLSQKLLNFLTRHGLIPTYSFPIHSTNLLVINEKDNNPFKDNDIALERDASIGISEYAPGNDVVAAGKIWTSRGIMIGKKEHIPQQYYYLCKVCHNVDISENKDNLPNECSFCGEAYEKNRKRKFIEPKTFITSYSEKDGKTTQSHRKRKLYSEEARLITIAKDENFVTTNQPNIKKALLSNQNLGKGKLFIVNRGPFGNGYYRCHLCNYMEPATEPKPEIKHSHKHLLSGRKCDNDKLSSRVDLAHIFETDVFILRFLNIDLASDVHNIARTITEATRFGVINLLNLTNYDIKATYKLDSRALDIILYDAVAGGAGYAIRLYEKPILEILKFVQRQLECPEDCTTGCRQCLCDYTNQTFWDMFKRIDALNFINKVMKYIDFNNRFVTMGAAYWENANLSSISEKISNSSVANFYEDTLFNGIIDTEIENWFFSIVNNVEKTNLFINNYDSFNVHYSNLDFLLHLKAFIRSGKLSIFLVENNKNNVEIPFIWTNNKCLYIDENSDNSILEKLKNIRQSTVYVKEIDSNTQINIQSLIKKELVDSDLYSDIERREVNINQEIDFRNLFNELVNKDIDVLEITDPYCGHGNTNNVSSSNRVQLKNFINSILSIVNSVNTIVINCKEPHPQDKNHEAIPSIKNSLKQIISQVFSGNLEINVKSFNEEMHRRFVTCNFFNTNFMVTYDIESGIDRLLRRVENTHIFMSKIIS